MARADAPSRRRPRDGSRSGPPLDCYALVIPGLEDLAGRELRTAGARVSTALAGFDRRDSIVPFAAADVALALREGVLEDVFVVLWDGATPSGARGARDIAASIGREEFERAAMAHHAVCPRMHGRTYKVVARVAGRHAFRREDLERALAKAAGGFLPRWREATPAALEVWAHVIGPRTIVGLRVSGDELAQRRWKRRHVLASLKPTVARALVLLSEPRAGDIFLDPMCGAGTIVRERMASRAAAILGGDLSDEMLDATRANAGRQPLLCRWDARRLPVASASVDVVVTNPPYGRQHEAISGLPSLYRGMASEAARVLKPGGRCVVLTGEPAVLRKALPPSLALVQTRRLLVRGLPVNAFVLRRQ